MGLINDLKKIFFGAEAVGKSAAEKVVTEGKAKGAELLEHTETGLHQAKEKASALLDNLQEMSRNTDEKTAAFSQQSTEKADALFEKSPQEKSAEQVTPPSPPPPKQEDPSRPLDFSALDYPDEQEMRKGQPSTAERIGGKILETTLDTGAKVEKAAEELGHKVLDAGEVVMEKFKETAEQVGGQVLEKGGELLERAREFGSHLLHKAEELSQKAEKEAAAEGPGKLDELIRKAKETGEKIEEKAKDRDRHFSDIIREGKSGTLDKSDDFFSKAQKFADGDYHAVRSKPEIGKDPNFQPGQKSGKTRGFEDQDGDGEDLIDDAIVEKP